MLKGIFVASSFLIVRNQCLSQNVFFLMKYKKVPLLSFRHWLGAAFSLPLVHPLVVPTAFASPLLLHPLRLLPLIPRLPHHHQLVWRSEDQALIDNVSYHSDLGPAPTTDAPSMGAVQEKPHRGAQPSPTAMASMWVGVATGASAPGTARQRIPHNQEVRASKQDKQPWTLTIAIETIIIKLPISTTVLFPEQ